MRKIFTVLLFSFCVAVPAAVFAHPPTDIIFTFDLAASTVKLVIEHQVKDPVDHFIHEIELKVNGKKAIVQEASTQTSADTQTVVYVIPGLKAGDKVSATGDCNKFGELTKEAVAAQSAPAKPETKPAKKVK